MTTKVIEVTEDELDKIINYLNSLLEFVRACENSYIPSVTRDKLIKFIEKLSSKKKEYTPQTIELIIARLLEQKEKIYDELKQKYKKIVLDEDWSVDKLIDVLKREQPELMGQLFFLDMELRNLGYQNENN